MKTNTKTRHNSNEPVQAFYRIPECAALAKCSTQTIMRHIKSGKLKASQPGGPDSGWIVAQGNLVEYLYGDGTAK
jgi:hypothetical protein